MSATAKNSHCFVPGCKTGYSSKASSDIKVKRSLFSPSPKNLLLWNKAIPRADKQLSLKDRVCELHFETHHIIREDKFTVGGETVILPRGRPLLHADAVPCIFPNLPQYLSRNVTKPRRKLIKHDTMRQSDTEAFGQYDVTSGNNDGTSSEPGQQMSFSDRRNCHLAAQCPPGWVHFDESQFEKNRRDGRRKLKPNAVPTIYNISKRSRKRMKHDLDSSDSPDQNNQMPLDAEMSCGDEYQPTMKKRQKMSSSHSRWLKSVSSWQPDAEEKSEKSFDNEDNGREMEATRGNGSSTDTASLDGMASSVRTDPLRSSSIIDLAQTPSIPLETQMNEEEENLLKQWDTTVRLRHENSLSIRPISADSSIRIRGEKGKPAGSIDLAPSRAIRFDFPEIDVVNRRDTSHDDTVESMDDNDPRGFVYVDCPTTGRRTARIEMNVEGFEAKDITVKCFEGRLTVHGIKYDACKKSMDEFCRKIKLPNGVTSESLRGTYCEHVLVLEAPVQARCSTPELASKHLLNRPVVLSDENGRYLSLVVELGQFFRPSDVVVKVKGKQTICVFADVVEKTSFSRMKATLEREFDLPEKIDQRSLRAGCTEDRLLKIVARIREPSDRAVAEKGVRIEIGDGGVP